MQKELVKLPMPEMEITTQNNPLLKKIAEDAFNEVADIKRETTKDYLYRIDKFLHFIKINGLNQYSCRKYKKFLRDDNSIGASTKNKYLTVAKLFCRELAFQGFIPVDITLNVKGFGQTNKHKRSGLTKDEIRAVNKYIKEQPDNTRLNAIVCLMSLQGLREIEIARIEVKDLNLAENKVEILGKGRDDKEPIDLHPKTIKALKAYLKTSKIKDGALFAGYKNQSLTRQSFHRLVSTMFRNLEINKTPHSFRHSYTTLLLDQLNDMRMVQQFTRHKSRKMLEVYDDHRKTEAILPKVFEAFDGLGF